jgi:hypothetical protein
MHSLRGPFPKLNRTNPTPEPAALVVQIQKMQNQKPHIPTVYDTQLVLSDVEGHFAYACGRAIILHTANSISYIIWMIMDNSDSNWVNEVINACLIITVAYYIGRHGLLVHYHFNSPLNNLET